MMGGYIVSHVLIGRFRDHFYVGADTFHVAYFLLFLLLMCFLQFVLFVCLCKLSYSCVLLCNFRCLSCVFCVSCFFACFWQFDVFASLCKFVVLCVVVQDVMFIH